MKIAFLSDFHLGFSPRGREEDAFKNALSAVKAAVKERPDAIVFTGDMFHKDIPEQETLLEAFRILSLPRSVKGAGLVVERESKGKKERIECSGIPFIAIHGTHEFRGRDFANAMQVLEGAGFMVYLHAGKAAMERHREKTVFHGLGGVPEKKALDALRRWSPKPEPGAYNILLLHQSLKEFMPFEDEMVATISISDIPEGFDLVVNGHLHWNSEVRERRTHLLMPGSTVVTQMKNLESKKKKAWFLLDTRKRGLEERAIAGQRPFHYAKIDLMEANAETVKEKATRRVRELIAGELGKKPLVKIKLTGTLAKGFSASDLNLREISESFAGKAIVSVSGDFREESFRKKIKELGELQKQRKPISELGLEILEKNLGETDFGDAFDPRRVFSLLKENESEKAMEIVSSPKAEKEKSPAAKEARK